MFGVGVDLDTLLSSYARLGLASMMSAAEESGFWRLQGTAKASVAFCLAQETSAAQAFEYRNAFEDHNCVPHTVIMDPFPDCAGDGILRA